MDGFQKNTVKSFRKVKEDMKNLQAQITDLHRKLEDVMDVLSDISYKKGASKSSKKK